MFPKPAKPIGLWTGAILVCLPLLPLGVSAQESPPSVYVEADLKRPQTQMSTLAMVGGGIGLGAAGFLTGAIIGSRTAENTGDEWDGLEEAFVLGSITGGIALPWGVHLANKQRGDGGKVVLTSLAIGAAGWWAAFATDSPNFFLVLPVIQLIGCVAVEQATAQHNMDRETRPEPAPGPELQVGLTPTRQGLGLVIGGRF